jgi:hypothetical protein
LPETRYLNGLMVSQKPWYGPGDTTKPPVKTFAQEEIAANTAANRLRPRRSGAGEVTPAQSAYRSRQAEAKAARIARHQGGLAWLPFA